jgi:hypothetical protein
MTRTDSEGDESSYAEEKHEEQKLGGRFGYAPVPSEIMGPISASPDTSVTDVFGMVLSLGGVQPIWQHHTLFCYRGYWQPDDRTVAGSDDMSPGERREVIITIATGCPLGLC